MDSGSFPKQDARTPAVCPKCGSPGHDDSTQQLSTNRMLHMCSHCHECFCTVPNAKSKVDKMTGFYSVKLKAINPSEKEESLYQCLLCNKMFGTLSDRNAHLESHTGVDTHMCTQCGFLSHEKSALEAHIVTHKGEQSHKCPVCCKVFGTSTKMDQHLTSHLGDTLHRCTQCKFVSTVKSDVQSQMMTLSLVQSEAKRHEGTGMITQNINICIMYSCSSQNNQAATMLGNNAKSHEGESSLMRLSNAPWPAKSQTGSGSEDDSHSGNEESPGAGPDSTEVHSMLSCHSEQPDVILGKPLKRVEGETGHLSNEQCRTLSEKNLPKEIVYMCTDCKCVFSKESAFQTHLQTHTVGKSNIQSDEGGTTPPIKISTRTRGRGRNSRKPEATCTASEKAPKSFYAEMYKCPFCSSQFGHESWLRKHLVCHRKCALCETMFSSPDELNKHMLTHTVGQEYKCTVCDKWFSDLQTHMTTHTRSIDRHDVQGCTAAATMQEDVKVHAQSKSDENIVSEKGNTESEKPHKCSVCGKSFMKKLHLARHTKTHSRHEKSYVCFLCGQKCVDSQVLRKHMKRHTAEKQHQCSYCGKQIASAHSLNEHIVTQHTGEKSHQCSICDKQFPSKLYLRKHIKTHSEEKPHECPQCDKRYRDKGDLNKHVKKVHEERDLGKHTCSSCGKQLRSAASLRHHEMVHTGEAPFPCSLCDKRFREKGKLKDHMLTHTGERPHMCSVCGKTFPTGAGLKTHMKIHAEEKAHECSDCGKKFYHAGNLKSHMRTHTGEKPYLCTECGRSFSTQKSFKTHSHTQKRRGRKKKKPDNEELTEAAADNPEMSSLNQPFVPVYGGGTPSPYSFIGHL